MVAPTEGINLSSILWALLPSALTALGWYIIACQNKITIARQENWLLLQKIFTLIESTERLSIDYHTKGLSNQFEVIQSFEKMGTYIESTFGDNKIMVMYFTYKEAITGFNFPSDNLPRSIYRLESEEILKIISASNILSKELIKYYKRIYKSKRL